MDEIAETYLKEDAKKHQLIAELVTATKTYRDSRIPFGVDDLLKRAEEAV
jgi:hypothetical protein